MTTTNPNNDTFTIGNLAKTPITDEQFFEQLRAAIDSLNKPSATIADIKLMKNDYIPDDEIWIMCGTHAYRVLVQP